jgi:hypothetical protein
MLWRLQTYKLTFRESIERVLRECLSLARVWDATRETIIFDFKLWLEDIRYYMIDMIRGYWQAYQFEE